MRMMLPGLACPLQILSLGSTCPWQHAFPTFSLVLTHFILPPDPTHDDHYAPTHTQKVSRPGEISFRRTFCRCTI
eukprot:346961-Rhodomonas_salina.1